MYRVEYQKIRDDFSLTGGAVNVFLPARKFLILVGTYMPEMV